ncbi:MAG: DNA polymerase III subunit delta, partial [Bacteroidota bacterium]
LASTIFVVSYKEKKVDGRTKLAKTLKEKGVLMTTKKMYDNQLPEWTKELVENKGLSISQKALRLVVDHIGNDLSRIENEIEKLSVNLGKRKNITEEDIEEYVGVSKDFNVFELQGALANRDVEKAIRIIQYFDANPKVAPIQLVLPSLYGFFSKVFMIYGVHSKDEKTISQALGVHSFFIKDYMKAAQAYSYAGVEKILLLLHNYNLKSVGINNAGTGDASLLKEMIVKMIA